MAAIAGALVGAELGAAGLPAPWLRGIRDWPLGIDHIHALASALASGTPPPGQPFATALVRNLAVLAIIAGHVVLRAFGR